MSLHRSSGKEWSQWCVSNSTLLAEAEREFTYILNCDISQVQKVNELNHFLSKFESAFRVLNVHPILHCIWLFLFDSGDGVFAVLEIVFVDEEVYSWVVFKVIHRCIVLVDQSLTMRVIIIVVHTASRVLSLLSNQSTYQSIQSTNDGVQVLHVVKVRLPVNCPTFS